MSMGVQKIPVKMLQKKYRYLLRDVDKLSRRNQKLAQEKFTEALRIKRKIEHYSYQLSVTVI